MVAEAVEDFEGGEVGVQFRPGAGRGEVVLSSGPERYGPVVVQSAARRLSWSLIRARSAR